MKSTSAPSFMTIVAILFSLVASVAGAESLASLAPKIGGWGAAAYAIVAAVFIGISVVIVVHIMSSVRDA